MMGDRLFIEFHSAVAAVRGAHDVQRAIAESLDRHDDDALPIRVGIDVETSSSIETGSPARVSASARIQPLASPGEVVMTAAVRDYVWTNLGLLDRDVPRPYPNVLARKAP